VPSKTRQGATLVVVAVLAGACGGGQASPTVPATPAPARSPVPTPTPTPPIDDFAIIGSEPPPGGVIHTGVWPNGVTTAFHLTLSDVSAADRRANVQVFLEGPQNGVCLEDTAPDKRPGAPDVDLKAGVPVLLTIGKWRVTSVCSYPNRVTSLTVRMMPSPDIFATPIYEERFAAQYDVTR
jgi:hypothetical protein